MTLALTAIWAILVAVMFYVGRNEGYERGVGDGTLFTLHELRRQRIIEIDDKTQAIFPGSAPKQSINQLIKNVDL